MLRWIVFFIVYLAMGLYTLQALKSGTRYPWLHYLYILIALLILGNFSEMPQGVSAFRLQQLGFEGVLVNLLDGRRLESWRDLHLGPFGAMWLVKA